MSYTRNYVIAGGKNANPSSLSVNVEPVRLQQDMGIAVKSIAYGEVHNVNERNNTFKIKINTDALVQNSATSSSSYTSESLVYRIVGTSYDALNITNDSELKTGQVNVTIPVGRYDHADEIFGAVTSAINEMVRANGIEAPCKTSSEYGILEAELPEGVKLIPSKQDTPLSLINATYSNGVITVYNNEMPSNMQLCFIYLNIIQNSFINGRKSRLLCVCPCQCKKGYTFHEFANPTFVPIEVREFSDITVSLRDIKGNLLAISKNFDTVITLQMKKLTE